MANEIKQTVVIEATLTKIQADLKRLEGDFRQSFGNISNIASSALGTIGIGLSVGSFVAFGKSIVDLGDKLSDLRDETGLSIEVLGGIKPVLDSSNSSLETFAKGFAKFQRGLGDFEGQGKQAAEALRAIKLDPAQLINASSDQALEKIVTGLAGVENANQRAAIAGRLFGKSAAEIVPTILQLSDHGIPKLSAAAADAYERLGKLKDQLVFAKAEFENLAAVPIADFLDELVKIGADVKDLAAGFNGLFEAFSGGVTVIDALSFVLKGLSYVIQGDVFALLALEETLLKIARVAPLVAEALTFNKLDFNSKGFTKEIEKVEGLMDKVADRFLKDFDPMNKLVQPAKKPPRQPAQPGLLPSDALKDATKAANAFIEAIEKEIIKIREQNIAFFQGADAAKAFALQEELVAAKHKAVLDLVAKGIPLNRATETVNKAFAGVNVDKFVADLKAARDEFLKLADDAAKNPDILNKVLDAQNADDLKNKITAVISRIKEARDEIKNPTLLSFNLTAIDAEFKKAQDQAQAMARVFGDSFDKSGQDAADLRAKLDKLLKLPQDIPIVARLTFTTKAELDQKEVDKISDDLKKQIDDIQERASLLGPAEINLPGEIASAERGALGRLTGLRTPAGNQAAQNLAPKIKSDDFATIDTELRKSIEDGAKLGEVLGDAFDEPANAVDRLTAAIQQLIQKGFDPLDPRIQQLKAELEDARAAQRFADVFTDIGHSFSSFLDDLSGGTKLKDALKNLSNNIRRALNDAFITKPLEDLIKQARNDLFGNVFKGVKGVGGVAGTPDQAAIAGIQSQVTAATTAIESAGTTADTAITSTSSVAQTSIESIQAVAIEAIQATAAAAQAGTAGADLGSASSLFGLFGSSGSTLSTAQASLGADPYAGLSAGLAGGFHEGGLITRGLEHASFRRALVMHDGGEVPIIGQAGEYMFKRWSTARIGKSKLDYMNETGEIPDDSYVPARSTVNVAQRPMIVNINNPNFTDRRSQQQTLAKLGSTVKSANRNL
jgi:hypothetical protein